MTTCAYTRVSLWWISWWAGGLSAPPPLSLYLHLQPLAFPLRADTEHIPEPNHYFSQTALLPPKPVWWKKEACMDECSWKVMGSILTHKTHSATEVSCFNLLTTCIEGRASDRRMDITRAILKPHVATVQTFTDESYQCPLLWEN